MLNKKKSINRLLLERIRAVNHFKLLKEALGDFIAFSAESGKAIRSPYAGSYQHIFGTPDSATLTNSKVAGGREAARSVKIYRVVERTPGAKGTTYLRQVHPYDVVIDGKKVKAGSYIQGAKPMQVSTNSIASVQRLQQSGIPGSDKWKPTKSPSYKTVLSNISKTKNPDTIAKNVQRLKDMGVDPAKADKFGQNRIAKITKATGAAGGKKTPPSSSAGTGASSGGLSGTGGTSASSPTRTRADLKKYKDFMKSLGDEASRSRYIKKGPYAMHFFHGIDPKTGNVLLREIDYAGEAATAPGSGGMKALTPEQSKNFLQGKSKIPGLDTVSKEVTRKIPADVLKSYNPNAVVKSSGFRPGQKSSFNFNELDQNGIKRTNKAFKKANITLPANHPYAPGGKVIGLVNDGSGRYIVQFAEGGNDAFTANKLGQDAVDQADDVFQKASDRMRKLRQFKGDRDARIKKRNLSRSSGGPTNANQKLIAIQKEALKNAKDAKEIKSIQKTLRGLGAYDAEARKAVKSRVKELRLQKGGGGISSSGKRVEFKAKKFRQMNLKEKITYMRRALSKARTRTDFKVLKYHAKRSKIYVKLKTAFNKAIKAMKAAGSFIPRVRKVPGGEKLDKLLKGAGGSPEKQAKIIQKMLRRAKDVEELTRIRTSAGAIGINLDDVAQTKSLGIEDDVNKALTQTKGKTPTGSGTSGKAPPSKTGAKTGGKNPLNPKGRQVFKPGGKVDQGIKAMYAAMQTKAAQYPKTAAVLGKVGTAAKFVFKVMPAAFGALELWNLYANWDSNTTEQNIADTIMAGANIALLVAELPVALAFMGGQMAGDAIYGGLLGPIDDVFYQIEKMAKAKMGKLGFFSTGGSTLDTQAAFRLGDGVIGRSDSEGEIFKKAADASGYKGMKPKELNPGYVEKIMITMQATAQAKESGLFAKIRKSDSKPVAKLERLFDYKVLNRFFFEKKFKEWQKKTEQESLQAVGASLATQQKDGFKPTKTPKGEIVLEITKEDVEKALQDTELLAKIQDDPKFEEFRKQIMKSAQTEGGGQVQKESYDYQLKRLILAM